MVHPSDLECEHEYARTCVFLRSRRSKAPFKSSPGDPEDDDEEDYSTGASLHPGCRAIIALSSNLRR